ncbi:MAG: hypothetical protein ACXWQR_21755 [Ktedonobacterales bacterium]
MRNDSIVRRTIVDVVRIEDVDAAAEVIETIAGIAALPLDVLPAGPARDALFALAEAGHDVSVYQPFGMPDTWNIWCRPEYPYMQGRYSPQEWQAAYAGEVVRILGKGVA